MVSVLFSKNADITNGQTDNNDFIGPSVEWESNNQMNNESLMMLTDL